METAQQYTVEERCQLDFICIRLFIVYHTSFPYCYNYVINPRPYEMPLKIL